ncbi:MAG: hypothetical protein P1U53_00570 [Sulfitobacter sp.]|nr:hypothetical protein [Sulfitobacter sp.]
MIRSYQTPLARAQSRACHRAATFRNSPLDTTRMTQLHFPREGH